MEPIAAKTFFPGRRDWLFLAGLLLATAFAYQPAWHAGFIWDDDGHLTGPELQSAAGLKRIWFELGATQQYYPLLHSLFWVEHRLWGDDPTGYHLVNLALHGLNVVLLWLVLRRLRVPGAMLAAGIFALHPVMVESVAWVTEQKNTLSGVFYFGAALVYLRFDENRRAGPYLLALGLFVLALLSKTVTATLPAALLVVFWWRRGTLSVRRDVLPVLPFFVAGAVSGLFTAWVERMIIGAEGRDFMFTVVERGLIAGHVVWFYLGKLLWPAELIFFYPRWTISAAKASLYVYPAGVLLALGVLWWRRDRSRGPLAGALIFIGTLFPVLGFFNVYPFRFSFVADHFQYLASVGMIVTLSAGAARRADGRRGRSAAALVLLGVLAVLTWRQSRIYHDPETLYRATLARDPRSWVAHTNLGSVLARTNRPEEAITHYAASLALKDEAETHRELANALMHLGRRDEALSHYEAAVRLAPNYPDAHNNYALALAQAGRLREAVAEDQWALRLRPRFVESHYNLALVLVRLDRLGEAMAHYREAIRIKPGFADAHRGLGDVLAATGRYPEAVRELEEALRLNPGLVDVHLELAVALWQTGRTAEAIAHGEELVRLKPNDPEARDALAKMKADAAAKRS